MSEIQDEAYTEACEEIERLKGKLAGLKALCIQAVDALETLGAYNTATETGRQTLALIAELREVAE